MSDIFIKIDSWDLLSSMRRADLSIKILHFLKWPFFFSHNKGHCQHFIFYISHRLITKINHLFRVTRPVNVKTVLYCWRGYKKTWKWFTSSTIGAYESCTFTGLTRILTCKLVIENTKIKQVQFKYLKMFLTEDGKCNTQIQRCIGITKDVFQKLSQILRNRKISLETKRRVVSCDVLSVPLYVSESWKIPSQMKKKREATKKEC